MNTKIKLMLSIVVIILSLNYLLYANIYDTLVSKSKFSSGISFTNIVFLIDGKTEFASYYGRLLSTPNFKLNFVLTKNRILTTTIGFNSGINSKRKDAKRKYYNPENFYVIIPVGLSLTKEKKYGCYGATINILNTFGHRYHFGFIGKGEKVETSYFYRPAINLSFDGGVKIGNNLKFVLSPGICFQYKNSSEYMQIYSIDQLVLPTLGLSVLYDFKPK
jgi:hypothetical protein